jgi:iron complex transport system ATP-binding protein
VTTLDIRRADAGYPNNPLVLRGIDLHVAPGEMLALIGPNGSGKSTLLRLTSGVLRPRVGQVRIDGADLRNLSPKQRAQMIAVVPQEAPLPTGLLVREMVSLGRTPYLRALLGPTSDDRRAVESAIAAVGIEPLAERLVDELSGGERQRVILARALAQQPRLLLLDEPTANLDLHYQVAMLELVRGLCGEYGLAVLAAVHDLQLAALYCDRVALLSRGHIVSQGTPEAVLTAPLLLETFEQQVVLSAHPTHGVPLVALVPNGNARRLIPG